MNGSTAHWQLEDDAVEAARDFIRAFETSPSNCYVMLMAMRAAEKFAALRSYYERFFPPERDEGSNG